MENEGNEKKLKPLKSTSTHARVRPKSSKGPSNQVKFDNKNKSQERPGNI